MNEPAVKELTRPSTPPRTPDMDAQSQSHPPQPLATPRSQGQRPQQQQQQSPEAQREAAAARARHVTLQKPRRAAAPKQAAEQRKPSAGNQPFTGF